MSLDLEPLDPLPFDPMRPVEGFRCWNVLGGIHLGATAMPYLWTPGVNQATCLSTFHSKPDPRAMPIVSVAHGPEELCTLSCGCGLWAYHMEGLADVPLMRIYPETTMGRVRMWGRLQAFERGYRAEYAEVVELWDTTRLDLSPIAEHYGVPFVRAPAPIMEAIRRTAWLQCMKQDWPHPSRPLMAMTGSTWMFPTPLALDDRPVYRPRWILFGAYMVSFVASLYLNRPVWLDWSLLAVNLGLSAWWWTGTFNYHRELRAWKREHAPDSEEVEGVLRRAWKRVTRRG